MQKESDMVVNNVLLLGGTGTLSGAILNRAIECGYHVTVFNRGNNNEKLPKGVDVIRGDFKNEESLRVICNSYFDVVVDFLSRQPDDIARVYPKFQGKCKQYIFISSACVYLRDNSSGKVSEKAEKPNFNWSYSVEKFECEQCLKELTLKNSQTCYTIVRPYITYDDERIPVGISPVPYRFHRTIIERIKSGKPWFVWDGGSQITTVTHAMDFATFVVALFMNPLAMNDDFHITGDCSCTHLELIEQLFLKLQKEPNIVNVETREIYSILPEYKGLLKADRALYAQFDNTKIKSVVPDQSFRITVDMGLDRVLKYWDESKEYDYDYKFEGRIDKLLSKYAKVGYIKYPHASKSSIIIYYLYRCIPLKMASKIAGYAKKIRL